MRGGRLFISSAGEPFRGPDGLKRWFDAAGADHDGVVTRTEFRADFMRYFKVLDANHDGVIDGTENGLYETQIVPEITSMGPSDPSGGSPGGGRGGRQGGGGGGGRGGGHGGGHGGGMGGGGMGGGMSHGGGGDRGDGDSEGFTQRPRAGGQGMARREGAARFSLLNIPQPIRAADSNLDWKVTAEEWAKAADQRFALLDTDGDGKLTLDTLPALPGHGRPGGHEPRAHQENPR
jgi:Ca2+-binding EF-hand superfamily protein